MSSGGKETWEWTNRPLGGEKKELSQKIRRPRSLAADRGIAQGGDSRGRSPVTRGRRSGSSGFPLEIDGEPLPREAVLAKGRHLQGGCNASKKKRLGKVGKFVF